MVRVTRFNGKNFVNPILLSLLKRRPIPSLLWLPVKIVITGSVRRFFNGSSSTETIGRQKGPLPQVVMEDGEE